MAKKRHPPDWLDAQLSLAQWYSSGLGQSILSELEQRLSHCLSDIFGFQGLQVGNIAPERDMLERAGLHRTFILDAPGRPADLHGDVLSLPVATDSMKLVLFFHTLDFCGKPHQALREADRVLLDDGQLIVIGFNPYSAFGLRHLATGWRKREPWCGHFYSQSRVSEWLSVLDYRVLHNESLFVRPPVNSHRMLWRLRRLEQLQKKFGKLGGLYILQARKQTVPMSLQRNVWLPKRAALGVRSLAHPRDRVVPIEAARRAQKPKK
jgi:SAM-dependent methyltransferase